MTVQPAIVLIVDDEATIRLLLKQKLCGAGYQCHESGNASEALEKLRNDPVELAILDIRMPGESGTQLLRKIKASYPDTSVIMATAIADTPTAIQCMKDGADDYLTKPFNLDEVLLSVSRGLEKRSLKLQIQDYQRNLEQKVEQQSRKIRATFINAITSLAYALEAKDKYTSGHSQRVADISMTIARELSIPQSGIEKIELASLVHDIGKIGVSETILNKPERLTSEEFQHIRFHCETGQRILQPVIEDDEILKIVRHHHERYDGNGYPDGLSREAIPLGARILALSDAYDAMTSARPYRGAMSLQSAFVEITRCKGTQFDPTVAETFLKLGRQRPDLFDMIKPGARAAGGRL